MPRTLTEIELRTNLSQVITDACNGDDIIIARGNMPVVRLIPIQKINSPIKKQSQEQRDVEWEEKIAAIRELRKKVVVGPPITIEDIISARDEGRKYL